MCDHCGTVQTLNQRNMSLPHCQGVFVPSPRRPPSTVLTTPKLRRHTGGGPSPCRADSERGRGTSRPCTRYYSGRLYRGDTPTEEGPADDSSRGSGLVLTTGVRTTKTRGGGMGLQTLRGETTGPHRSQAATSPKFYGGQVSIYYWNRNRNDNWTLNQEVRQK